MKKEAGVGEMKKKFVINKDKNMVIPHHLVMKILTEMQLPIYSNKKVHFKDISIKLLRDAIYTKIGKEDFEKIGEE